MKILITGNAGMIGTVLTDYFKQKYKVVGVDNLSGGFFQVLTIAFGGIFNVVLIVLISFYL